MQEGENKFANEMLPISIEDEMKRSYLDYAMSVIMGRALPDVRDGLKPVHRRVLFAMNELGNVYNRGYKKSARIVGDVIGKYHPHGDFAVYETIVRLAQPFSMRYCLVDGQGNFGSVDGDGAAAMRYTEVRLKKIAGEMLADIDKDTVDFVPNYDGTEKEPAVLPTRLPALLVNGSAGIAVGMATNVPPHNIGEVVKACLLVLAKPHCTIDEILTVLPAPDFPTGGFIYGLQGVREAYRTGRGRVVIRAKTHIEEDDNGRESIIVDEIPYQVNKRVLLEKIAHMANDKVIDGISFVRDESDKTGMRGVIELKRGANADVVLNNLYKNTQLQDSFGVNLVALVNGQPKLLNIKDIISEFLIHRREVVTRRTEFELKASRARIYLVEGQAVALANIDEFIDIIKTSANGQEAEKRLLERRWDARFIGQLIERSNIDAKYLRPEDEDATAGYDHKDGTYQLTSPQAKNILQMRLQSLTGLEQDKIEKEYEELVDEILDLLDILAKPARVTEIIGNELRELGDEYSDGRMTQIITTTSDVNTKDLIPKREMVVTMTDGGYIKSQASIEYKAQKRGGMGKKAAQMREGDNISQLFVATTHDVLLCFSDKGRLHWLNVWDLPEGSSSSKGRPIVNLLELAEDEKITTILPISDEDYTKDLYVFMATEQGVVKKTPIGDFKNQRKLGINAINLNEGDILINCALTNGHNEIMLFSDAGKAVRFNEAGVRSMGRVATGVGGIKMPEGAKVVSMIASDNPDTPVLVVTENGYGKRSKISEFRLASRNTQGVVSIKTSERNGQVVKALIVEDGDELILLTSQGKLVRTRADEINVMSRNTQGVRLISIDEGAKVIGVEIVSEKGFEGDEGPAETSAVQAELQQLEEQKAEVEAADGAIEAEILEETGENIQEEEAENPGKE